MIAWRIYYTDGTTFDSSMGEPEDAPARGVAAISQADEDAGRAGVAGVDWYLWESDIGCWSGGDRDGMIDHFTTFPRTRTALKMARTMARHTDWRELQAVVVSDPDFPTLSRPFHAAYVTNPDKRGNWST